ncbi:TonB-dependent receptor [Parasphingorhabdus halotolerans]|uniref:TonB-dependent receptor n=1 Tax=Parasphingorhabdus halotolerans TaxID=2725558 RepID=A0A6H2DJK3_9SPHN|nr:TonB-dependent receptor [Parasphingorhabdus halotolerans]QJB68514.1 TonB-dependent receptor [Parasphingorhabdus halotolerans]
MRKSVLLAATAMTAMASPVLAQDADEVDDNIIIVTAQRQAQSLQEVPIAVSAFDAKALDAQQIENASDLQLTLPNVSFTKSNFTASSFTIRGIGDLCVGVSCDSATAIHLNDSPLFGTRLFETEYFDLERVEVLRGPQGTLFGRNATSGVVNVVTAKPELGEFKGALEGEYGNFDSIKVKGMLNLPVGDTLGVRLAGFYLKRDGYTENLFDNSRIDGRDMYAVRGSIKWEPTPDTTVNLMAYYFREDDNRARIQKQLCQRDPTGVLGCLNSRRDFGKLNANSTFTGTLGSSEFFAINGLPAALGLNSLYGPDGYAGFVEPTDVRQVRTAFTPEYFTDELQLQGHLEHNFGAIKVGLTGTYQKTRVDSRQDYNTGVQSRTTLDPAIAFLGALSGVGGPLAAFRPVLNAVTSGTQLCTSDTDETGLGSFGGNRLCADTPLQFDRSNQDQDSWSAEAIVSSDLDGAFNFLLGGIYAESKVTENSYYVNAFQIDYITGILGGGAGYLGTPFFRNNTTNFKLKSYGIFGEVYVDVSDRLKLTGGLRYNNDKKSITARSTLASFLVPFGQTGNVFDSPFVGSFDADPGTAGNQLFQTRNVAFDEITGRFVVDYQLTPDNLLYASYSRGYKSGGINPPLQPIFAVSESFGPEQIDSFEVGSKNVFADGALVLNATAFYYKYKGLQLSRIIARTSVNDTIDADIYGVELEAVIRPDPDWLVNMGFSYLKTKVVGDQLFSNPRDPGGGRADAVIVKDITNGANCAVVPGTAGNVAGVNAFVGAVNGGLGLRAPTAFPADGGIASTGAFSICNVLTAQGANPAFAGLDALGFQVLSPGVQVNLRGNELPQAPVAKASVGVQYTKNFSNDMNLVPRVDLTYTGDQTGSVFNGNVNKIKGFVQANASIQLNGTDDKWFVRAFIQNIFDSNSTTGLYLTDASSGLFTNIFTLDPRRFGIGAGIKF